MNWKTIEDNYEYIKNVVYSIAKFNREDLLNDVCISLANKNITSINYTVIKNALIDLYKTREYKSFIAELPCEFIEEQSSNEDLDIVNLRLDLEKMIKEKIKEEDLQGIALLMFSGKTTKEIAREINMSITYTRTLRKEIQFYLKNTYKK